jgi:hypothetical protein
VQINRSALEMEAAMAEWRKSWRPSFASLVVAALCVAAPAGGAAAQCGPQRDQARSTASSTNVADAYVPEPMVAISATPAADIPVWKTIALGTYRNGMIIRDALDRAGCAIGDIADEILGRPAFAVSSPPAQVDLVPLSVSELGFGAEGASVADVYARAIRLGLDLCPAEVGPLLRLQYADQPLGEFLRIAMNPIATYGGQPVDFTLVNGGTALALIGGEGRADLVLSGRVRLVFARPKDPAKTAKR